MGNNAMWPDGSSTSELIARVRAYEVDHTPDGWPAIKMKDVSRLANLVEEIGEDYAGSVKTIEGLLESLGLVLSLLTGEQKATHKAICEERGNRVTLPLAKHTAPNPPHNEAGNGYFIMADGCCVAVGANSGHSRWLEENAGYIGELDEWVTENNAIRVRHCYTERFFDPVTHKPCTRRDVMFTIPNEDAATLLRCQQHFSATYRNHDRARISPKDVWRHEINIGVCSLLSERYAWRQGEPTNWLWFVTELNKPDSETRGRLERSGD